MFKKLLLFFALAFFFSIPLESNAQNLLINGEIPNDLLITLKRTAIDEDTTITIKANGDCFFEGYKRSPRQRIPSPQIEHIKSNDLEHSNNLSSPETDSTKIKLDKSRIKSLISEFEKIQFFKFGTNYPVEKDEIRLPYHRHLPREVITIQINGKKKEIFYDRGNSGIKTEMLSDLANKIRNTIFWNISKDNIPNDLVVTLETKRGQHYIYVIKADGSVTYYPIAVTTIKLDGFDVADSERRKKKDKLSNDQLKEIISAFEQIDFLNLSDSYQTAEDGCTGWISGGGSTIISIKINGKTKKIFYKSGCISAVSEQFRILKNKIQKEARNVEAKVISENQK